MKHLRRIKQHVVKLDEDLENSLNKAGYNISRFSPLFTPKMRSLANVMYSTQIFMGKPN